ncbi:MAG TPA: sigma-70 family RNA polymerase sigma factor [Anaerolineae bacterium]
MRDDELEFQTIHETFRPKIHRYLTRLVGAHDAEDLTQEVFVKVSRALDTFRGESQPSTWIYRIATNVAIDKMRTASFQQEAQKSWLDDSDETEDRDIWTGEETPSLEQQLMRKEMRKCFERFVENLPPNYRTVVVLSLEQLTNNEIAEILDVSIDTVKIRLHRGRTRLLQELKARCKPEDWL